MVGEVNLTEVAGIIYDKGPFISQMPPELAVKIGSLITIFQAIGIVFIISLVFIIVRSILNIIEKRRIKFIYEKISEIDKKLDKLIDKGKKSKK